MLWLFKLFFITLCLFLWAFIIKWADVIFPTLVKQYKYHKAGEQYLEEKYGKTISIT